MSVEAPLTDSDRGYLSRDSKRRFTLVAGILGAVFFLAQTILPMALAFLIMIPTTVGHEFTIIDLDQSALWRDELWFVQRTSRVNWRDPENSAAAVALARARLDDLSTEGPALPLGAGEIDSDAALLPGGDRMWIIGSRGVGYYKDGSLTRLTDASRPPRASRPFVYQGRPALLSLGPVPALAVLDTERDHGAWSLRELALGLRPEAGSLRALEAVEAGGRLSLFAQLCTEQPDRCSLVYRELGQEKWLPVVDDLCSCGRWSAITLDSGPAVFLSEPEPERASRLALVRVGANGPRREPVELGTSRFRMVFGSWRPFASGHRLVLVSQGMPGSLRLVEWADGRGDLQPCGFKRAFLRNLLTFVDGFFSFLVGALLVALTENWQRLGDLAARTIVVADAEPAGRA